LKNAKSIPALKAVSQNLMHANLSVTNGIYGILSENDVREQIRSISLNKNSEEVISMLEQLIKKLTNEYNLRF